MRPLFVLLLLAVACEHPAPPPAASHSVTTLRTGDSTANSAHLVDPRIAGALVAPLAELTPTVDSTITLASWLASHPDDVVTDTATVGAWDEQLCRVASAPVAGTDGLVMRTAIFELPEGPVGDSLPTSADPGALCRLGAVQVSARFPDSLASGAMFSALVHALPNASPPQSGASVQGRMADFRRRMSWVAQAGRVVVAEMSDRHPVAELGPYDEPPPADGRRVLAIAYAPGGALDPADTSRLRQYDSEDRAERSVMRALADSALAMADIPGFGALLRPIMSAVKGDPFPIGRTLARDSALIAASQLVRDASVTLPPDRRAAALVALDFATQHLAPYLRHPRSEPPEEWDGLPDSLLRAQLMPAGIIYDTDVEDAILVYTRSLLTAAHETDSLGRGGHLAFLMLSSLGWNTSDACGETNDQFETVIAHGESAVGRGDDDPLTHYFLGLAWADVVTMAGERGGHYAGRRAALAPRSAAARTKAIGHLRTALAGLRDPTLRSYARRVGMALLLGESSGPRFYCVFVD